MRLLGIVLLWSCVSAVSAQTPLGATDISAADVQKFRQQLPRDVVSDRPIRVTDVGGYRVGIYGVFRPKASPGNAVFHETKMTEIYYVLEGGGTLVTGGALREPTARQMQKTAQRSTSHQPASKEVSVAKFPKGTS